MGYGKALHVALWGVLLMAWTTDVHADRKKDWYSSEGEDEYDAASDEDEDEDDADDDDAGHDEGEALQEEGSIELDEDEQGGTRAPGSFSLYGGGLIGIGGEAEAKYEGISSEVDLVASYGLQLGADYVFIDNFAAGAEVRVIGTNTEPADDADLDRDLLIDLVVKPRGRYVIESAGIEVYGTLPFGLSFPKQAEKKGGDASLGFTLGVGAGASYFLTEHFGIGGDAFWLWHWYTVEATNLTTGAQNDAKIKFGQFSLSANVIYAL